MNNKNKVIEELLKDVKKHQDTADSVEMLEFWKQVSYWLKLKQIEI